MSIRVLKILVATVLAVLLLNFVVTSLNSDKPVELPYSALITKAEKGELASMETKGATVTAKSKTNEQIVSVIPQDTEAIQKFLDKGVTVSAKLPDNGWLEAGFVSMLPVLLLIGVWVFFFTKMQKKGKGGGMFFFGKSKARMTTKEENNVKFQDVAGCEEAKEDVQEIVEFLQNPNKFHKLGGRIPKGILLAGSPGTGKTLLAKAIAGEAGVPFFSISGSDFVEMFVGVGASRVRDLFKQAKENAPCIIFIDEIDAVGRQRGVGTGGGNDEREQTLNQMLVEMDGFEENAGVIVIAATNRPELLDAALVRPGRFDRQVIVPLPDIKGRIEILKVHMRKTPIAADISLEAIAKGTPGFSGADLANLVNEAALISAKQDKLFIDNASIETAKDKLMMGAERKNLVISKEEQMNTAYHEAGHAILACLLPKTDPVHKVSIIPRGRALGVTIQLPQDDKYSQDTENLTNLIAVLFGGRVAEELFMGHATTGASNDFKRATDIARKMVMQWGMSPLGPMVITDESQGYLQVSSKSMLVAESTLAKIDSAVTTILSDQYNRAKELLQLHSDKMEMMAKALLEYETIDSDQIKSIMQGVYPNPSKSYSAVIAATPAVAPAQVKFDNPAIARLKF